MSIFWQTLKRMLTSRRPTRSPDQPIRAKSGKADAAVFEVERKFRLTDHEASSIIPARLKDMGFALADTVAMTDTFLPTGVKGEMLRVRDESVNGQPQTVITIKEWVEIAGKREREEQEEKVNKLERWLLLQIGRLLNGKSLLSFSKTRLMHESPVLVGVVIATDDVQGLGENSGPYAEIEVLVPRDGDVEGARKQISHLARELFGEDRQFVQASYQDMLKQVSGL